MTTVHGLWCRYERREPRMMLLTSVALTVSFAVLYVWFVRTRLGQQQDIDLVAGAQQLGVQIRTPVVGLRLPLLITMAAGVAVLAIGCWRRREWGRITAATAVIAGSTLLAEWLKTEVLTRPYLGDYGYLHNTFPSGHVAATAALAVATLLLWPQPRRFPAARAAAVVTVLSCLTSVLGLAHRPSDVIASVVLVALVTTAVRWVLPRVDSPA